MNKLHSLAWVGQPVYEKEHTEFQPELFHLRIDFVSSHARDGEVG